MTNDAVGSVIVRVYNNNLVLARQPDGQEVILMGRALGYAKHQGDAINDAAIEMRFVPESARADKIAGSLADASMAEARLASQVIEMAHEQLGVRVSQALLLAVVDHLVFAIRRAREGISIDIPLGWEVRQLYPAEVSVGRAALALVADQLGVQLPADEAVAFALHFVNAQLASPDISRTIRMTEMIGRVWAIVFEESGRLVNPDSVAAGRFVTHLRYLVTRLDGERPTGQPPEGLVSIVSQIHPRALAVAQLVAGELEANWQCSVRADEAAYLALHIARLWDEAGVSRGA